MASCRLLCVFVILGFYKTNGKLVGGASLSPSCEFPAVFIFGDSNSDTGAHSAAIAHIPAPYGETFFKKSSKRLSDGRLIVDIIGNKQLLYNGDPPSPSFPFVLTSLVPEMCS